MVRVKSGSNFGKGRGGMGKGVGMERERSRRRAMVMVGMRIKHSDDKRGEEERTDRKGLKIVLTAEERTRS